MRDVFFGDFGHDASFGLIGSFLGLGDRFDLRFDFEFAVFEGASFVKILRTDGFVFFLEHFPQLFVQLFGRSGELRIEEADGP